MRHAVVRAQPFLAADVGGTHARVALVQAAAQGRHGCEVLAYRSFQCVRYPGLAELLQTFIDVDARLPLRRCVIACAGRVIDDTIMGGNLAWQVGLSQLRAALGFDDIAVLNDFEALGYALDGIRNVDSLRICGPDVPRLGSTLVVGPGTGLGAALCMTQPGGRRVLASEAGQMDFAPSTVREHEVLARLAQGDAYVPYERILSGPGLLTLYVALCALRGVEPAFATPEAITASACAGDAAAVEAVDMFCAVLGSFTGNLAMAFLAQGGVYLAGGVLPEIGGLLLRSRFAERFMGKGRMREFLSRVPVRLIEHGRHGVLGAARWYLDQHMLGAVRGRVMSDGTAA